MWDWEKRKKIAGKPKELNLMQLAIYQYWWALPFGKEYRNAELIYGERGSGDSCSFQVIVSDDGVIQYGLTYPFFSDLETAPYTVFDIFDSYRYLQECVDSGLVPERDFNLVYSDEEFRKYVEDGYEIIVDGSAISLNDYLSRSDSKKSFELKNKKGREVFLTKASAEQWIKYTDRLLNGGRQVKRPEEGSKKCLYCRYQKFCYGDFAYKGAPSVSSSLNSIDRKAEPVSDGEDGSSTVAEVGSGSVPKDLSVISDSEDIAITMEDLVIT